jgi:hypothetical protein
MNIFTEFTDDQLQAALERAWSTAARDEIEAEISRRMSERQADKVLSS